MIPPLLIASEEVFVVEPLSVPAVNGFYTISSTEVQTINDIPTQVQVQDTYYFNEAGEMVTGWVKTVDNKTYFFENEKNANEGKMVKGWKKIENDWYYFKDDGSMLVNGITPDGYPVGADGKMM